MGREVGLVQSVYVFGNAELSVSYGLKKQEKLPFIAIAKLSETQNYITENILDKDIEESEKIVLLFKNKEGLSVLERMIKEAKKEFTKQDKLIKK